MSMRSVTGLNGYIGCPLVNNPIKQYLKLGSTDRWLLPRDICPDSIYVRCSWSMAYNVVDEIDISINLQNEPQIYRILLPSMSHASSGSELAGDVIIIRVNGFFSGMYVLAKNSVIFGSSRLPVFGGEPYYQDVVNMLCALPGVLNLKKLPVVKTPKQKIEITLGADPEFELVDDGLDVLYAEEYIDDPERQNAVGIDGASSPVELRPEPASTPTQFVKSLRNTFEEFNSILGEKYHLSTEGSYYAIGGHIHAGVGGSHKPSASFLKCLDAFIGEPCKALNGNARESDGYGKLGDARTQAHGFEYRTPPSAIFHNPRLTKIIMKIFYNLVDKYVNTEGFTYPYPVTKQAYLLTAGITTLEYRYFQKFLDSYAENVRKSPYMALATAFWTTKKAVSKDVIRNKPSYVFRDSWDNDVRREFTMGVRSCLSRQQYHGDVEFYGFSKERGFVSNMKVYGWDTMNNALWIDGRLSIGLPYDFRTDMDWFDDDKYNVYDAIETVLANRQDRSIRDEDEDEEEF